MRILHWDEMFHPTFGYQINVLAKYQANQGHDVLILTSENIQNHPTFLGFVSENIDIPLEDEIYSNKYGVEIIRLPIHKVISGRVIYKSGFIKKILSLNPDIIMCHTNDTLSSMLIALNYRRINKPIVFDNHMLAMASSNRFSKVFRFIFRFIITPVIIKQNLKVIRTQDDKYINNYYKIPEDLTPFISFGADTELFYPNSMVYTEFRKQQNIKQDAFVIIYAGKLTSSKGADLLAESVKEKFNTTKEVVIVIVGNTNNDNFGVNIDKDLQKSKNRVLRFPTQAYMNLPKFYQIADLCVFPKQCSLSFYDTQACGVPVVSENNNINIDRNSHGNGFCFKSNDVFDLRAKVETCINMPEKSFHDMRQKSIKFVLENYDYRNIAEQYTSVLVGVYNRFYGKEN